MLNNSKSSKNSSKKIIDNYAVSKSEKSDLSAAAKSKGFFADVDVLCNEINTILSKDGKLSDILLDVYDGNTDVSNQTMDFLRTAVDEVAKTGGMSYSELLSGTYETSLKNEVESLSKSLAYFRTVNTLGTDIASNIFKSVIG